METRTLQDIGPSPVAEIARRGRLTAVDRRLRLHLGLPLGGLGRPRRLDRLLVSVPRSTLHRPGRLLDAGAGHGSIRWLFACE